LKQCKQAPLTFRSTQVCFYCHKVLRILSRQGVECQDCGLFFHSHHVNHAPLCGGFHLETDRLVASEVKAIEGLRFTKLVIHLLTRPAVARTAKQLHKMKAEVSKTSRRALQQFETDVHSIIRNSVPNKRRAALTHLSSSLADDSATVAASLLPSGQPNHHVDDELLVAEMDFQTAVYTAQREAHQREHVVALARITELRAHQLQELTRLQAAQMHRLATTLDKAVGPLCFLSLAGVVFLMLLLVNRRPSVSKTPKTWC
jgi:hypothetical protein